MKQPDWRAAALQLQIRVRSIGVFPALSMLLFVLGVAGWLMLARPQGAASALADDALSQARQRLRASPTPATPVDAPQRALLAFEQVLGDPDSVEGGLRRLFEAAARSGLALEQGDYRWQSDRANGLDRYQVRLSTKGSYAAVRAFCERALLDVPFASLDELNLRREAVGDEAVVASVQFSLHLHGVAPEAAVPVGSP